MNTQVYVYITVINRICESAIKKLDLKIKEIEEARIQQLMKPKKFLWMTFKLSREEAEKEKAYDDEEYWRKIRVLHQKDKFQDLINACKISSRDGIWLSLEDANLIYNYKEE